jgi:hypothetical protein
MKETGRPQSVRILYKTDGKLIEKVDLTVKMKFKHNPNPRNQFDIGDMSASLCSNKVSDFMMVGKGDNSTTVFFGCRFWYDLSRKFYCEHAKILIMVG